MISNGHESLQYLNPGLAGLDYGLMIIRSNSASVQCFLCDFQLSHYHAICNKCSGMERVHGGSTQTGEDYSNTTVNSRAVIYLAGLCHNNSRIKLVRMWCNMQSTLHVS